MTTTDPIDARLGESRGLMPTLRAFSTRRRHRGVRAHIKTLLERGAVIVDTETTDLLGRIVQIAVIDLVSGAVLLDTLVDPGVPITQPAQKVHGISDADLVGAPAWPQIADRVWQVLHDRPIVAYNAPYDREVINAHGAAYGYAAIAPDQSWVCAMQMRKHFNADSHNRKLGGNHSAVGDCLSTRDLLNTMHAQPLQLAAV